MNGKIWVESAPGKGSTFQFIAQFGRTEQEHRQLSDLPNMMERLPVLVVDDNATNCRILEETLRRWKMRPQTAGSATSAMEALESASAANEPFALALLDGQMPEIDGFMLAKKIRLDSRFQRLKIVLLTSAAHPEQIKHARQLGVSGYLLKPVKQSELLSAIATAMGKPTFTTPLKKRRPKTKGGLRVLLAEDNPVNQRLQSRLLEKLGHRVTVVENGRQAVAAAESDEFDLIVMDVQMPEMDGLEAASIIRGRQKSKERKVPILALTAHAAAEDRERCRVAGMDGYLSKPVRIAELEDAIFSLFENVPEQRTTQSKRIESSVDVALINEQAVLKGLGGDRELFADVLSLFLEDGKRLFQDIQSAVAGKDPAALARSAHALKGSIANLSSGAAHKYSAELEKMGRNGEISSAPEFIPKLEDAFQKLRSAATAALRKQQKKVKSVSGVA
jgi:CheY-like chemotaxis protein